jgi:hypothetical protein
MNIKGLIIIKTAKFAYCTDGALWYEVDSFRFPVRFAQTVGACFMPEHKAINLMRRIKNQLEKKEAAQAQYSSVRQNNIHSDQIKTVDN